MDVPPFRAVEAPAPTTHNVTYYFVGDGPRTSLASPSGRGAERSEAERVNQNDIILRMEKCFFFQILKLQKNVEILAMLC